MAVLALSSSSVTLPIGGVWELTVRVLDADGDISTTAPTVTVTLPGGSTTSPTADDVGSGAFRALYTVGTAGRYVARVVAAGYGAADFAAYVSATVAEAGMPTFTDLDDYLGDHSWTDDELTDALNAEAAAQRAACRVAAVYPDDLRQALLRRAQRNLAMRRLPLAVLQGDADLGPAVLPGRDPEVRRLEAPHRKLPIG